MKIDVILWDGIALTMQRIDDTLEEFYRLIKCTTFEGYSNTEIGQLYGLDIFIDGNGKFEQDTITGIFVRDGKVIDFLAGNVLILRHDDEGNSQSVTDNDMAFISKHLRDASCLTLSDGSKWKTKEGLLLLNC